MLGQPGLENETLFQQNIMGLSKLAQWVRELTDKPKDLSSVLINHKVKGESLFQRVIL